MSAPALSGEVAALALHLSEVAAASAEALVGAGVTHVLNATPEAPMPACEPALTACMRVPVTDDIDSPLHHHLDAAALFIDEALKGGGRVLACCMHGSSVAPAVVAYYLMRYRGMRLADALSAIRAVAPRAYPNAGFWQRLVEAESWLRDSNGPSMTVQQYKWQYLEQSEAGEAREQILQRLEQGQAEVLALLHHHSYTTV